MIIGFIKLKKVRVLKGLPLNYIVSFSVNEAPPFSMTGTEWKLYLKGLVEKFADKDSRFFVPDATSADASIIGTSPSKKRMITAS